MGRVLRLSCAAMLAVAVWAPADPVGARGALFPAGEAIRVAVSERLGPAADLTVTLLEAIPDSILFREARPDPGARLGRPIRFTLIGQAGTPSFVSALVSGRGPQVVARQAIGRGHVVGASAVSLQHGELTGLPLVRLVAWDEVVGTRALRPIDAGAVLLPTYVALKRAVEPGDAVTVVALSGPVEVRGAFVAADGGRVGDVIRVRNPDSRKFVRGRIVSAGIVEVFHER